MFQPGIPIPREVVKLTGITDEDVASAPEFVDRA
jgi:DNA polymerase III epsilon subunit-like protein